MDEAYDPALEYAFIATSRMPNLKESFADSGASYTVNNDENNLINMVAKNRQLCVFNNLETAFIGVRSKIKIHPDDDIGDDIHDPINLLHARTAHTDLKCIQVLNSKHRIGLIYLQFKKINKAATHSKEYTPIEILYHRMRLKSRFQKQYLIDHAYELFGCKEFVKKLHKDTGKLDDRAVQYIFVGNASNDKGYRFINTVTWKTLISQDAVFYENKFSAK